MVNFKQKYLSTFVLTENIKKIYDN